MTGTGPNPHGAGPPQEEVGVCGLWHLGTTAVAGLLSGGRTVLAHDPEAGLREAAARGVAPTDEPGVGAILTGAAREGRLRVVDDAAWACLPLTLVAYDSAVDEAGGVRDERLDAAVAAIAEHAPQGATAVVMSQVPAGTHDQWRSGLLAERPDIHLVHVPENLRLGEALQDFLEPPRLILGATDAAAADRAAALFPGAEPEVVTPTEAELVKHATNAYLGMCVAFANDLAWIGAGMGADPGTVARLLKRDPRVSPKAPLRPGAAFSGATLRRDLVALARLGADHGRSDLFETVLCANERHARFTVDALEAHWDGGIEGRRVAVAGLTYKPTTSTLRDSLPLRLVGRLLERGARVCVYDPVADPLPDDLPVRRVDSLAECVEGADTLLVASALPELGETDWSALRPARRLLVDGCAALDSGGPGAAGWLCLGFGAPQPTSIRSTASAREVTRS